MLLPILAFFVAVLVVLAIAAALIYLPKMREERRLELRLREVSQSAEVPAETTVVMRGTSGPLPLLDRLAKGTSAGSGLSRLIEQSGVRTTPSAVLILAMIAAMATAVVFYLMLPRSFMLAIGAAFGMLMPFGWLMRRRTLRLRKFEEHFPEALDLLSRAIRAGHAFTTAMGMVAEELPEPVGPEFKKTFDRQNFGLPLRDAMSEMADRIPILDVRFFVTSVAIQRETGGNLAEILDNLAHVVRERFKIRRQVRVHTAHGRFTGYVLLALPAALAVALSFISPDHMKTLFENRLGQMMVAMAIVMQAAGYVWIRQVIKIEV